MVHNSPYSDAELDAEPAGIPPAIQHVLYIVKENRTYDQVLGDIGEGASDPSLCLFPEKVGPNHHKLAREFVLLDNFYVNGDVSADGHNWSTSAISNDFVEKLWPSNYAHRHLAYGFEGGEPAAYPPAGYLWTNAAARGVSMRNYGYWVENKKTAGGRWRPDRQGARSGAHQSHQPEVSRLRRRLPRRRARAGLSRRPGGIREDRNDAVAVDHAPGQRPHQRHHARKNRAALVLRRQRLRSGHDRGRLVAQQVLEQHGHLRRRRRLAERA